MKNEKGTLDFGQEQKNAQEKEKKEKKKGRQREESRRQVGREL